MADLLEQSSAWLDGQNVKHRSRLVTYQRVDDTVEVHATIGKTVFEVDDAFEVIERVESRDFLLPAAELVLDGKQVLPERGDRIRETQDDKVYVYEVLAPGRAPHWKFSDDYRRTLRIHTKHVATEA